MRKQIYELTAADLDAHPVWEFALDEEATPGQDEATVRPYDTSGVPVPAGGMFAVRTTFTLANGTTMIGYLYYTPELPADLDKYGPLGTRQPVIVTPEGQIMFWYGRLQPSRASLADIYRQLAADATGVFPIHYVSGVPLETGPVQGELHGFYYLADKRKGWLSKETTVETMS